MFSTLAALCSMVYRIHMGLGDLESSDLELEYRMGMSTIHP